MLRLHWIPLAAIPCVVAASAAAAQAKGRPVAVRGVAYDGLRGKPLRDATITLVGGARNTTTDSRGRFRFDSVSPGTHTFAMQHATLDSLGFSGLSTRATIVTGEEEIKIAVPTFAALWRAACGGRAPNDSGFVYGTVRNANDLAPVANAAIDLVWTDLMLDKRRRVIQRRWRSEARTDSSGSYSVCGVAAGQWLRIQASLDSSASGAIDLAPSELRVQRRDLLIGATSLTDSSRRGTITGMITDGAGDPFVDARVLVDGAASVRSGADGRFIIPNVFAGTRQVEISSVGMTPVVTVVDVVAHDTAVVTSQLAIATKLGAMEVVASRTGKMFAAEFSDRKKKATGYILDSTAIARYRTIPNVLASAPSTVVDNRRGVLTISMPSAHGKGMCAPEVRIDGVEAGFGHLIDLMPNEVAGLEVYPRALMIPTQFLHGAEPPSCGMILVWTKYGFRNR